MIKFIRFFITLLLLFLASQYIGKANSSDEVCLQHPIYCKIVSVSPKIDKTYAMKLSDIIFKMSKKYTIPSNLMVAIFKQESNFILDNKHCKVGIDEDEIEMRVCFDFGISMINYKTMWTYKFNKERLLTDLDYSVEAGFIVLNGIKNDFQEKEVDYWVRYNCGYRKNIKRVTCQWYKKLVERYL